MEVTILKVEGLDIFGAEIKQKVDEFAKVASVLNVAYRTIPKAGGDGGIGYQSVAIVHYEDDVEVNEKQARVLMEYFSEVKPCDDVSCWQLAKRLPIAVTPKQLLGVFNGWREGSQRVD